MRALVHSAALRLRRCCGMSARPFSISFYSKTVRPRRAAASAVDNPALTRSSRSARPFSPPIRRFHFHDPHTTAEFATQLRCARPSGTTDIRFPAATNYALESGRKHALICRAKTRMDRYPYREMCDATFPLSQAAEALDRSERREVTSAALLPQVG